MFTGRSGSQIFLVAIASGRDETIHEYEALRECTNPNPGPANEPG